MCISLCAHGWRSHSAALEITADDEELWLEVTDLQKYKHSNLSKEQAQNMLQRCNYNIRECQREISLMLVRAQEKGVRARLQTIGKKVHAGRSASDIQRSTHLLHNYIWRPLFKNHCRFFSRNAFYKSISQLCKRRMMLFRSRTLTQV